MPRRLSLAALVLALVAPGTTRSARAARDGKLKHAESRPDRGPKKGKGKTAAEPHPSKSYPAIALSHLSSHENFVLRPDGDGHFTPKRLNGWRHFLRCHHTGREHPMSPRLAQVLYSTARHFNNGELLVIAGYRAPKVARKKGNPKSPHKRGVACDFRVTGVSNSELRDYLRSTWHDVGVGFYPNSGFIHVDVGRKQSAFWIDYSGPGERAEYSRDPDGDLATGRANEKDVAGAASSAEGEDDDTTPPDLDDPGMADLVAPPAIRTPMP